MGNGTFDKIKGAANKAIGAVEEGVGKVTGSEDWTVAGRMNEEKGDKQNAHGDAEEARETAVEDNLVGADDEESEEKKRRDLDIDLHPGMNS